MEQPEKASNQAGVYHRSIQSGKWFMLDALSQKFISIIAFLVLARILVPDDYGVIALVVMVGNLLDQLTNFMFGDALLQRKDSIEKYLDACWTFDLARALILTVLIYFCGGFLADFFHMQGGQALMMRLGGVLVLMPYFCNSRQAYFFKDLNFRIIFYRNLFAQLALSIATVAFALFINASAWALFAGYIAQSLVGITLSYVFYPVKPRLDFHFGKLRELVSYSKWVYAQSFLALLFSQIDKLTVGRMLNTQRLGLYSKSKDLASMSSGMITSMIRKIGLPAFSKVQDRLDKIQEGFIKSVDLTILVSLPLILFLIAEGGTLVSVLLGPKWLALVVPLKIFAFGNLFLSFMGIANPVLGALGRPDINFKTSAFQALLSIPLMCLGYYFFGANGLAVGVVIVWFFVLLFIVYTTRPILKIGKKAFIPSLVSAAIATAVAMLSDLVLRQIHVGLDDRILGIGRLAILGLLYFIVLYVVSRRFKQGPWSTFLSILKELHLLSARINVLN